MTQVEISSSLQAQRMSWLGFVCNPAINQGWGRAMDVLPFKESLPMSPNLSLYREMHQDFLKKNDGSIKSLKHGFWYLQTQGSTLGPLNEDEMLLIVRQKKSLGTELLAWKVGQEGWLPIAKVPELQTAQDRVRAKALQKNIANRRASSRATVLAIVEMTYFLNGAAIKRLGICRDISPTGLFVVTTERIMVGSVIVIKVVPYSGEAFAKFEGTAKVLRHANDEGGMALSHEEIAPEVVKELEEFVEAVAERNAEPFEED